LSTCNKYGPRTARVVVSLQHRKTKLGVAQLLYSNGCTSAMVPYFYLLADSNSQTVLGKCNTIKPWCDDKFLLSDSQSANWNSPCNPTAASSDTKKLLTSVMMQEGATTREPQFGNHRITLLRRERKVQKVLFAELNYLTTSKNIDQCNATLKKKRSKMPSWHLNPR